MTLAIMWTEALELCDHAKTDPGKRQVTVQLGMSTS